MRVRQELGYVGSICVGEEKGGKGESNGGGNTQTDRATEDRGCTNGTVRVFEKCKACCSCRKEDYARVDEGFVPEEDGECFTENHLIEWTGFVVGISDGGGEEELEEDEEETLNGEYTSDSHQVGLRRRFRTCWRQKAKVEYLGFHDVVAPGRSV